MSPRPDRHQPLESTEVADGEVDGTRWRLRWLRGGHGMDGLAFSGEFAFGHLPPLGGLPLRFAATAVGDRRLVWGLAPIDAVAVRVVGADGSNTIGPVVGPECDGAAAFVVVLPHGAEPERLEIIRADGSVAVEQEVFPAATAVVEMARRIEVRPVYRDAGRVLGHVVLEGTVDDGSWELTAQLFEGDLHTGFQHLHSEGGGGGASGGPAPVPTPTTRLGVMGSGASGRHWHLKGWADPSVTEVVLQLRSGERLHLPVGGRELDAGFVLFAVALPAEALAVFAEGLDADGRTLGRLDLRGHLGRMEAVLADDELA